MGELLSFSEVWQNKGFRQALAQAAIDHFPKRLYSLALFLPTPVNPKGKPDDWLWLREDLVEWALSL